MTRNRDRKRASILEFSDTADTTTTFLPSLSQYHHRVGASSKDGLGVIVPDDCGAFAPDLCVD